MDILILGGTGAMGSHVSELLKDKKNKICITSRRKQENRENIFYLQGNAKELIFINELCKKHWDVIIDFMVYTLEELQFLNLQGNIFLLVQQEYMQIHL